MGAGRTHWRAGEAAAACSGSDLSDFLLAMTLPLAAVVERAAVTGANLGQDGRWTDALARGRGSSGMFRVRSERFPAGDDAAAGGGGGARSGDGRESRPGWALDGRTGARARQQRHVPGPI